MPRELKESLRLLLGLGGVAVGAALFAIAFRLSLAWLYRSLYHGDNVVDGITKLPLVWRLLVPVAGATAAGVISRWARPWRGFVRALRCTNFGSHHRFAQPGSNKWENALWSPLRRREISA